MRALAVGLAIAIIVFEVSGGHFLFCRCYSSRSASSGSAIAGDGSNAVAAG
jgi:hypothetical protein